jgi:hypothetical protein
MGDSKLNGQARRDAVEHELDTALREQAGAERYQRRQRRIRRGRPEAVDHPGPLEFDRNGFPIAQRSPSFVTRVARLLNPL